MRSKWSRSITPAVAVLLGFALWFGPGASVSAASRAEDAANGFVVDAEWRWVPLYVPYIQPQCTQCAGGGPFHYESGHDFMSRAVGDALSALAPRYTYCGPPPTPMHVWLYPHCAGGVDGWLYQAFFADSAKPGERLLYDSNNVYFWAACPNGTDMRFDGTSPADPDRWYCYTPRRQCRTSVRSESTQAGNPCDAATGNKSQTETDYPGSGDLPAFTRSYSSQVILDAGLGTGWTSPFHKRLILSTTINNRVYAQRGNGYADTFSCVYLNADCTQVNYAETGLYRDAAGYTLKKPDGSTERYDTSGLLVSESDPAGLVVRNYGHDAYGRLIEVTGRHGHSLYYTYDASGHLASLTDPAGSVYSYFYDTNANLIQVNYPDGTGKRYHYERPDLPNALTGISHLDAQGNATRYSTYGYNDSGLAISTTLAGGLEAFVISYDSPLQSTITDAAGTQEVLTFSIQQYLKYLTAKTNQTDGKSASQTFDSAGYLRCKKDQEGRITTYNYTSPSQVRFITEGLTGSCASPITTSATRKTEYLYLSDTKFVKALPTEIRTPSVYGTSIKKTKIVYSGNLPRTITQSGFTPAGLAIARTTTLGYANGQVVTVDGPRTDVNDITTFSYYDCVGGGACGQLASVTNALGQATTYDSYDAAGRLLQMTDPNGLRTSYTYDFRGRVSAITVTPPGGTGRTTSYTYNGAGNIVSVLFPDGRALAYTYSAAQKLTRVTDNLGNYVEYSYDLKGNRTGESTHDSSGTLVRSIETAYDARNRIASVNAGGSLTQQVHDAIGNLVSETDPNSNPATTHSYDVLNRLFQTIDRLGGATTYGYDVNDRLKQVSAPNAATTQYVYDDLGNLLQEVSPDRGTTTYTYDAAGNVKTMTDARGITVTYTYDALNRATLVDYPGAAEDVVYTYDTGSECTFGAGRLCAVQDASGTTRYAYDAFGNLTEQVKTELGVSYTTHYAYDAGNRVTSITYPDGRVVSYERDGIGRIAAVTATVNGVPTVLASGRTYRPDGLLTAQTYGNNLSEVRQYDLRGRLTYQSLGSADTRLYGHDANGNLTSKQSLPEAATYGYDALDRLTQTSRDGGTDPYAYDPNGNRLSDARGMYDYVSATNRLSSVPEGDITLDPAGNLLSDGTRSFAYNGAGHLASVDGTSYLYDHRRLRTRKTAGSAVTVYHYDLEGRLLVETDAQGRTLRAYVHADDQPLAQIDVGTEERLQYLHADHQGTPRLATNASGTKVWSWEGEAFGNTEPNGDPDGDGTHTVVNLRYPGQFYDGESGLFYNWNRYYDPRTGRYITFDPIGIAPTAAASAAGSTSVSESSIHRSILNATLLRGLNQPYAYVENNPLRWIDPVGLKRVKVAEMIMGVMQAWYAGIDGKCAITPGACIDFHERIRVTLTAEASANCVLKGAKTKTYTEAAQIFAALTQWWHETYTLYQYGTAEGSCEECKLTDFREETKNTPFPHPGTE